jgi:hypothetical protein
MGRVIRRRVLLCPMVYSGSIPPRSRSMLTLAPPQNGRSERTRALHADLLKSLAEISRQDAVAPGGMAQQASSPEPHPWRPGVARWCPHFQGNRASGSVKALRTEQLLDEGETGASSGSSDSRSRGATTTIIATGRCHVRQRPASPSPPRTRLANEYWLTQTDIRPSSSVGSQTGSQRPQT